MHDFGTGALFPWISPRVYLYGRRLKMFCATSVRQSWSECVCVCVCVCVLIHVFGFGCCKVGCIASFHFAYTAPHAEGVQRSRRLRGDAHGTVQEAVKKGV